MNSVSIPSRPARRAKAAASATAAESASVCGGACMTAPYRLARGGGGGSRAAAAAHARRRRLARGGGGSRAAAATARAPAARGGRTRRPHVATPLTPSAMVGFEITMIFSARAEYGVRLMVELGRQAPDQPVSLKALADAEGLPLANLEQVVARLRRADLVMSARGAHGGYWLARDAAEITMYDVVAALEGPIAPMECFVHDEMERIVCSHLPRTGTGPCATKLLWTRVQAGIMRSLQTTTLAELVEFSRRGADNPEPQPEAEIKSPGPQLPGLIPAPIK